ncbi:MAG: SIS domain-containing protein [Candidatus Hodarchaeales archaeon]
MSSDDYMWTEIVEQPQLMNKLNSEKDIIARKINNLVDNNIIERIVITGCGDSYCASIAMEQAFRNYTGVDCRGIRPMDLTHYDRVKIDGKALLIAVSVSGKTPRVIEAVKKAKASGNAVLGVTDNPSSLITEIVDESVLIKASPPETLAESGYKTGDAVNYDGYHHAVAQTKTYTQALLTLAWTAISIGSAMGHLESDKKDNKSAQLKQLPTMVESIIGKEKKIKGFAETVYNAPYFVYTGSGPCYGNACYAAFKNYEYAIPGFYNDIEEYAHTQYFITERNETPVIFISQEQSSTRVKEILPVVEKVLGGKTWLITPEKEVDFTENYITVPELAEELSPLITAIPLEIFTYFVAKMKGVDVNYFRGGKDTELYVSGSYKTIRSSGIKDSWK